MEIERQRLLDEAAERDATRLRLGDDGAGVGAFPPENTQEIAQNLSHSAIVPAGYSLSLDASQTLAENEEYQQLLREMNALASGLLASSANPIVVPNESDGLPIDDLIRSVPVPGRKRPRPEDASSSAKKPLLEIPPPSMCENPLQNDSDFRAQHASLSEEILAEISLRPTLQSFSQSDANFTAYLLVRGGLSSIAAIKLSLALNRKYFLQDLRDENLSHRDLLLLLKIFETFPPTAKNRNAKHPEFEEVCIPLQLNRLKLSLTSISGLLLPDQRMVNAISELLAKGQATSPAYVPYPHLSLIEEPWVPSLFEHRKANEAWAARMTSLKSDQALSVQGWLLYRLRFIISAEVCGAWSEFGGLIAQINNIGVFLNLAIVENVGVALKYHEFLHTQLELSARGRATDVDFFRMLSEEQIDIRRRFAKIPAVQEWQTRPSNSTGGRNTNRSSNKKVLRK